MKRENIKNSGKHRIPFSPRVLICLSMICAAALIIMTVTLIIDAQKTAVSFTPPGFDSSANAGVPTPNRSDWGVLDAGTFSVHICGKVTVSEGKAELYFTNDPENTVWMKLRISDADGNIIAQTGIIKPGEYIESVYFDIIPPNDSAIDMKIMTYEPDTYYSMGAVSLSSTVQVID